MNEECECNICGMIKHTTWISVKDELPQKCGVYWVAYEINGKLRSHYSIWQENSRKYKGSKFGWKSRENVRRSNIKYWMPLPPPPKSEKEKALDELTIQAQELGLYGNDTNL